jgi:hypothetical protein
MWGDLTHPVEMKLFVIGPLVKLAWGRRILDGESNSICSPSQFYRCLLIGNEETNAMFSVGML